MDPSLSPFEELPLKGLHLPPPVSWWPPAPGWWGLAALSLLLLLGGWLLWRRYRRNALYRAALRELDQLRRTFGENQEPRPLIEAISVLLRRIALSMESREDIASLAGEPWLRFLDSGLGDISGQRPFSEGAGRVIIEAPYNPNCKVDGDALIELVHTWIHVATRGATQ